tara:strand:+ start:692 stop:2119 length:1428 start_codon:yes stop_codon:yes gene_type:complete
MEFPIKKVCCIGAGYVGGPSMSVMAYKCPEIEFNVVDKNKKRIEAWNSEDLNNIPIYEQGLSKLIIKCRDKNLFFSNEIDKNIADADMIFISVNTPTKTTGLGAGKAIDLKWIESCARQIAKYAKGHTIVVEKSTLPVKTAQAIKSILDIKNKKDINDIDCSKTFSILSNPEFLAEGTAIDDLLYPDRILIGGDDASSIELLKGIYLKWVDSKKILTTDIWSSELSKLIANAFLAQRISSINSVSALCESTEANISDVAKAIGMDSRIGEHFLSAGPGFGGSCFKKDILNLVYICNHYGLKEVANYWEKVIDINNWQQNRIVSIIVNKLYGTLSDKKISILGFSFKSNTNDTRESPAINICRKLLEEGCNLNIYDPKVSSEQIDNDLHNESLFYLNKNSEEKKWNVSNSIFESVEEADAIIILTNWSEFYNLKFKEITNKMRSPYWIFDTRNIINTNEAKKHGINIWKIGNGNLD